jgi:hypothetical protein
MLNAGLAKQNPITTGDTDSLCHPLHLHVERLAHSVTAKIKKAGPNTGPASAIRATSAYIFGPGPALRAALLLRKLPLLPKNIRAMHIFLL